MRIGTFVMGDQLGDIVASVAAAHEAGFDSVWGPQIFGADTLTALAVAAREVPDIPLGTAVVPTYLRHPVMLAAQARTVQQAGGGDRLTLGIGLSHQIVIEGLLGIPWEKPVRHLREYLSILLPLVRNEAASFSGETLTANIGLGIRDTAPVPVLVAALGTQMLTVTGRMAEGTITWMTGPTTIADHIVPTITAAAAGAGRPTPRVVCCLPVCVTDDVADGREKAGNIFSIYDTLPSYKAMLDREGADGPADVAIVGDEATVRAGVEAVFAAGATEFVAVTFAEQERTNELLLSMRGR